MGTPQRVTEGTRRLKRRVGLSGVLDDTRYIRSGDDDKPFIFWRGGLRDVGGGAGGLRVAEGCGSGTVRRGKRVMVKGVKPSVPH